MSFCFCWVNAVVTEPFFLNRRLFHVCTFFLFFFNIFLGVFSCLKRIIVGAVLGVMFLGRTQKSVIPRDFELKDPGLSDRRILCTLFGSLTYPDDIILSSSYLNCISEYRKNITILVISETFRLICRMASENSIFKSQYSTKNAWAY